MNEKLINDFITKINDGSLNIAVMGLGYTGLPLALLFASKYKVIGFDIDSEKINSYKNSVSIIPDISNEDINKYLNKSFFVTDNQNDISIADVIIICVPTLIDTKKNPDLTHLKKACNTIKKIIKKGMLIVLESTTFPGTTEDIVAPLLSSPNLKAGKDFFLAYSPERIDPGNQKYNLKNVTKIISGINEDSLHLINDLYISVFENVFPVSSCRTAEAQKLVENVFRAVNIAYINDIAILCEKLKINIWEVISASSTKPFGFLPFYPGPGIGGNCIPINPYYLTYVAKKQNVTLKTVNSSILVNEFMPTYVVGIIKEELSKINKSISNSTISILGLSYKKNIGDLRESPSIIIIKLLNEFGANIKIYDPYFNNKINQYKLENNLSEVFTNSDCAIFLVDHNEFKNIDLNLFKLMKNKIVIDCKNIINDNKEITLRKLGVGIPN